MFISIHTWAEKKWRAVKLFGKLMQGEKKVSIHSRIKIKLAIFAEKLAFQVLVSGGYREEAECIAKSGFRRLRPLWKGCKMSRS